MTARGMTLLELVVGLTVTGLTVLAGLAIVATVSDRQAAAVASMTAIARAATQRDAIVAWLSGARLGAGEGAPEFRGLDGIDGRTPQDEVTFLTTAATPLGTGEAIVRLYADRDSTTLERGLVAAFTDWRGSRVRIQQIDTAVIGMNLRFLTGLLGDRQWTPSWISSTVLPAAIEIDLIAAPGDSLNALLRLPILVAIRGGR
jgi:hypothetical protein